MEILNIQGRSSPARLLNHCCSQSSASPKLHKVIGLTAVGRLYSARMQRITNTCSRQGTCVQIVLKNTYVLLSALRYVTAHPGLAIFGCPSFNHAVIFLHTCMKTCSCETSRPCPFSNLRQGLHIRGPKQHQNHCHQDLDWLEGWGPKGRGLNVSINSSSLRLVQIERYGKDRKLNKLPSSSNMYA